MVTARREDIDKIRGLGLGADDYIVTVAFSGLVFHKRLTRHHKAVVPRIIVPQRGAGVDFLI